MATQLFWSKFQKVFNKATISNTALVASITAQSDFGLKNLKDLQEAYHKLTTKNNELVTTNTDLVISNATLFATNNNLMERVNALKGVDKKLVNACELVKEGQNALNQALRAHNLYKNQNAKLVKQL